MTNANDNDKVAAPEPAVEAPATARPAARPPRRGFGRLLGWLLLLAVLAGIAVAGWFGWQWLARQKAGYEAELDAQAETLARLQARLERLEETGVAQQEFEQLRGTLGTERQQLQDRMNALDADMEALREAAQGGRRDLIQAEVEYLLRIAADELYLTQDVDTAIYALQSADDRLRQLADPRFTPVRELINDHLRALGAVNLPDSSGMALKVGSLMREVASLPLRQAQHARAVAAADEPAPADAGWWQRLAAGIDRLFARLVVVQRAEPPPPLLTPEEHFHLYRNVELQLAAARSALLAGDVAAWRQSLELAREWLNRFFDRNDPAVANAIADIGGLLEVSLQPELPDITPALERFRRIAERTARAEGARRE